MLDNAYVDAGLRLLLPPFIFNSALARLVSKLALPLLYLYQALSTFLTSLIPPFIRSVAAVLPWFAPEFAALHVALLALTRPFRSLINSALIPLLRAVLHATGQTAAAAAELVRVLTLPLSLLDLLLRVLLDRLREAGRALASLRELAALSPLLAALAPVADAWTQHLAPLLGPLAGLLDRLARVAAAGAQAGAALVAAVASWGSGLRATVAGTVSQLSTIAAAAGEVLGDTASAGAAMVREAGAGLGEAARAVASVEAGALPRAMVHGAHEVTQLATQAAKSRVRQLWDAVVHAAHVGYKIYLIRLKAGQDRVVRQVQPGRAAGPGRRRPAVAGQTVNEEEEEEDEEDGEAGVEDGEVDVDVDYDADEDEDEFDLDPAPEGDAEGGVKEDANHDTVAADERSQ
jgi:hypothetical protein